MLATLSSSVLVLLVSATAQMPKEPDFSGHWDTVQTSGALVYRRLPNAVALERAVRGLCEREARKDAGSGSASAGNGMRTPKRINQVQPAYPPLPPNTRVKSNAWLGEILLDQTGRVSGVWTIRDMQFVPPFPAFNLAVVDEIRRWRFEPAMIDGKAVRLCMTTSVLVDFW